MIAAVMRLPKMARIMPMLSCMRRMVEPPRGVPGEVPTKQVGMRARRDTNRHAAFSVDLQAAYDDSSDVSGLQIRRAQIHSSRQWDDQYS